MRPKSSRVRASRRALKSASQNDTQCGQESSLPRSAERALRKRRGFSRTGDCRMKRVRRATSTTVIRIWKSGIYLTEST